MAHVPVEVNPSPNRSNPPGNAHWTIQVIVSTKRGPALVLSSLPHRGKERRRPHFADPGKVRIR
ncbi:hypothetical protein AS9A_2271 [Hoyosella subflava DQS3-9A1]|uniref:Uncharacterized protein n=1 Tax=Hoyosella subflava (strain DSM 45089 / JCM 17490 / NBRC 109087 / DQS3-9A1) TaxID=443218 RepID=F6ER31_HOYSD|nr:hypothetical protein AS9A_2271 [Hoyosella subflava DQS3-9A1]